MARQVDMERITLSDAELDIIQRVGDARQDTKDRRNIPDGRLSFDQESHSIHVLGFAAEYALAKYLGVEPDMRVGARGHRGIALRYDGYSYNTHYNRLPYGALRYMPDRVPKADRLVLVLGRLPTLLLAGWCERDRFLTDHQLRELPGQGERWTLEQTALHPIRLIKLGELPVIARQLSIFDN